MIHKSFFAQIDHYPETDVSAMVKEKAKNVLRILNENKTDRDYFGLDIFHDSYGGIGMRLTKVNKEIEIRCLLHEEDFIYFQLEQCGKWKHSSRGVVACTEDNLVYVFKEFTK